MDIKELKELLKTSTSVLVMDDGEPTCVILGYEAYKTLAATREREIPVSHPPLWEALAQIPQVPVEPSPEPQVTDPQELEMIDRLNREIENLREQIAVQETEEIRNEQE
ncbi:MAG: hypothetical protein AAB667_00520 [Patescibacteria group bacterium]